MRILGIESSCDETSVAVVRDGRFVESLIIATQDDLHRRFGGVVPEIASRAHLERLLPALRAALEEADARPEDLHAVAVGNRPGLIGSLLVGVSAAKALAWAWGKPLLGVDHVEAHLHAAFLDTDAELQTPALGLVVSGGHTSLFIVDDDGMTLIGRTIDDAVGEAYDKAASILGLPYPGGPNVDAAAQRGSPTTPLPLSRLAPDSLDFSFSGLKTALLYAVRGRPVGRGDAARFERGASDLSEDEINDFCASFQEAAVAALLLKVTRALDLRPDLRALVVGGGVSANSRLRSALSELAASRGLPLHLPPMRYCLDNAAMIAAAAFPRFRRGRSDDLSLTAAAAGQWS